MIILVTRYLTVQIKSHHIYCKAILKYSMLIEVYGSRKNRVRLKFCTEIQSSELGQCYFDTWTHCHFIVIIIVGFIGFIIQCDIIIGLIIIGPSGLYQIFSTHIRPLHAKLIFLIGSLLAQYILLQDRSYPGPFLSNKGVKTALFGCISTNMAC